MSDDKITSIVCPAEVSGVSILIHRTDYLVSVMCTWCIHICLYIYVSTYMFVWLEKMDAWVSDTLYAVLFCK